MLSCYMTDPGQDSLPQSSESWKNKLEYICKVLFLGGIRFVFPVGDLWSYTIH